MRLDGWQFLVALVLVGVGVGGALSAWAGMAAIGLLLAVDAWRGDGRDRH